MTLGSSFLAGLNAGDDSIGSVLYTNIATVVDELVQPYTTSFLAAGDGNITNRTLQSECWARFPGHLALIIDGAVYSGVQDALAKRPIDFNCFALRAARLVEASRAGTSRGVHRAGGRPGERRWGPVHRDTERPMRRVRRAAVVTLAGALAFGGAAGCGDDEDGDGGTTDEEIQEGEDRVEDVGDEVQEEIDAQDEGSNEDGE